MRALCCLAVALSSCAGLPAQLQNVAKPSLPTASGPPTSGALPAVALPRPTGACPPEKNHCVRATTWFWIEHALYGSASPTTPVYEKDGTFVSYEDGKPMRSYYVLRTQLAVPSKVKVHDVLIVWRPRDQDPLWPESEDEAQTPSHWVVMVVETVDATAATFTIQGRPDVAVPLAAARSVVERKEIKSQGQR